LEASVAFLEQFAQVAQLLQRSRAAGWVSYGQNISGSPLAVPGINAVVLSGLCEYRRKSYIAKTRFFGYFFVGDIMGLLSTSLTQSVPTCSQPDNLCLFVVQPERIAGHPVADLCDTVAETSHRVKLIREAH